MAEGFKNRTPEEQRRLADSVLEQGFTALAKAIQEVGLCAKFASFQPDSRRVVTGTFTLTRTAMLPASEQFALAPARTSLPELGAPNCTRNTLQRPRVPSPPQ
jgi:hypothetical protein